MKKIFILILISAIFLLTSCVTAPTEQSKNATNQNQPVTSDKKIRIGFSMDTLKEHWTKDKALMEKKAAEMGAEIIVSVAESNDEKQLKQIDDFLTKGIDVLIVVPHNSLVAASAVEKCKKQNVPVVSYDRLVSSDDVDVVVAHLHSTAGQMQAEYALKNAPKGNYVLIYGAPTDNNALVMKETQNKILKPFVDKGDIKIVADQHAKEWSPEEALKIAENALTNNKNEVVAFVCSNDGTAGGAIQAIKSAGLTGKVVVTGMDAQIDALQRIAQGEQSMTVYKPLQPLVDAAVEAAVKLAKGEKPTTTMTMKAINKEIPFIFIQPKVVDKNNLMDIVKDNYESYEDIFKNVPEDKRPPKQ